MTVSEVLEERRHRGDAPTTFVSAISLAGHALLIAAMIYAAKPKELHPPLFRSLPVRVVTPGSLTARPGPAPAPAAQKPAEKPKPVIEKMREKDQPVPSAKAMPVPATKKKETPKPALPRPEAAREGGSAVELPSPGGLGGGGGAGGVGPGGFGTSVSAFDVEFPYAYYAEQLQSLIGGNWLKPNTPPGTACVVSFRIQKSGQVVDVRVTSPSGLPYYDRAATRAIYAANPLPPLPADFGKDELGVNIRFQ